MGTSSEYWQLWAPYWKSFEDNFLGVEDVEKVASLVRSPTLLVGAGQGLLVERLQNLGLSVQGVDTEPLMIEYAKKRRGLRLVLADGMKLPFADNSYRDAIVSTGVIDFIDDTVLIKSILDEARRVTQESGNVLVAFYRFNPRAEELLRFIHALTPDGRWLFRKVARISSLNLKETLKSTQKEANKGYVRVFLHMLKVNLLMPPKEQRAARSWKKLWKQVDRIPGATERLINCVPESVPYRDGESIKALFARLRIAGYSLFELDSCRVAQVPGRSLAGTREQ